MQRLSPTGTPWTWQQPLEASCLNLAQVFPMLLQFMITSECSLQVPEVATSMLLVNSAVSKHTEILPVVRQYLLSGGSLSLTVCVRFTVVRAQQVRTYGTFNFLQTFRSLIKGKGYRGETLSFQNCNTAEF